MYSTMVSVSKVLALIIALCFLCTPNTNAQELRWRASGDIADAGDRSIHVYSSLGEIVAELVGINEGDFSV